MTELEIRKRYIEEKFPVKEVSVASGEEQNDRGSKISHIGLWWARRPLITSISTQYAALIPFPDENDSTSIEEQYNLIKNIAHLNCPITILNDAKKNILNSFNNNSPKVIDPFGGGGSLPLEAMKLGCETYSNDYNPIAVLIQKCTMEFPQLIQKYNQDKKEDLFKNTEPNPIIKSLGKWGSAIIHSSEKIVASFYDYDLDNKVYAFLWSRTVPCQNPSCQTEIPLRTDYWLSKKNKRKIALFPVIDNKNKTIEFQIIGDGYQEIPDDFDPNKGNIKKSIIICPICGSTISDKETRRLFTEHKNSEKLIAVVLLNKKGEKHYRIVNEEDILIYNKVQSALTEINMGLTDLFGFSGIPDEILPDRNTLGFRIQLYGFEKWSEMYNARQLLEKLVFIREVKNAFPLILEELGDKKITDVVISYLGMLLTQATRYSNSFCSWSFGSETVQRLFARNTVSMLFNYSEINPFNTAKAVGSYQTIFKKMIEAISELSAVEYNHPIRITQASATQLPYEDNYFDAVFTDPPYYDNIPYAYLSDFFYIWIKRVLNDIYPDLFTPTLTPKSKEIVAYSNRTDGMSGKEFFESMLNKAFREIYRILKPYGIAIIVYAHKSLSGWETLINSLLDSNLVISGAWALQTESKARSRAIASATLASSIYIIARKIKRLPSGIYNEVKLELARHLERKLKQLWNDGIGGADFFIAAIGSAIEIFGKYENVIDYDGNVIRADKLLEEVQEISTDFAVKQILHNGFANEVSDLTRFYVLWRWNYESEAIEFDEANKLARSCNIALDKEWADKNGFIKKNKNLITILGPEDRKLNELKDSNEMIDVLHKILIFWEKNQKENLTELLIKSGFGKSDIFYRVAQAISESLSAENKEKKLLDGFLAGRERFKEEVIKENKQKKLDEIIKKK